MSQGSCYFITCDVSDDGEAFNDGTLVELVQYEFDHVKDLHEDERRQVIADLLGRFKRAGAIVEGDAVTFGDGFRAKWFAENFQRVQELVASMTIAEFAEGAIRDIPDSEGGLDRKYPLSLVRRLIDDGRGDAVWYGGRFYSMDDFIRGYATGNTPFYVRGAVYMA